MYVESPANTAPGHPKPDTHHPIYLQTSPNTRMKFHLRTFADASRVETSPSALIGDGRELGRSLDADGVSDSVGYSS